MAKGAGTEVKHEVQMHATEKPSNLSRGNPALIHIVGDFVEQEKEVLGKGPSDNFSYGELTQLGNDYKAAGGR